MPEIVIHQQPRENESRRVVLFFLAQEMKEKDDEKKDSVSHPSWPVT